MTEDTNWFAYCVDNNDVVTTWTGLRYSQAKWRNDWMHRQVLNNPKFDVREYGINQMQPDGTPPPFCGSDLREALRTNT